MAPMKAMKAVPKAMKAPMKSMKVPDDDDDDDDDASQTEPPMKVMKSMNAPMKSMKAPKPGQDTKPKAKPKAVAKAAFPDIQQLEDKKDSDEAGKEDDKDNDAVVDVDEEDEEEEVPEGQEDTRTTSRAQRHVFQKYFGQLSDEVQDAWLQLKKPGAYGTGKQEKKMQS